MSSDISPKSARFHIRHNRRLLISALLLATGPFTFGYDGSVIGGALAMPAFINQFSHKVTPLGKILTATDISIISAVPTSGALFGAFIVAYAADRIGRKKTIFIGCAINLVGVVIQTASYNIAMITVGRIIASTSIFILVNIAVTFQNEIAPRNLRGAIGSLSIVSINLATVVTAGISWGTYKYTTSSAYRIPFGLQCLWPIIIALGAMYLMDSPTSFLIKGDDIAAKESLTKVRQGYTNEEIEAEMDDLKLQEALREEEIAVPWQEIFKGANLRRTLIPVFYNVLGLLSGQIYASTYATIFLTQIGTINPFLLVFGLNLLALGGAVCGLFLVDWMGRRALGLFTFSMILFIDAVIGAMGFANPSHPYVPKIIAAFCLMFGFFYAAGFGPLTYILPAEIPNARLRNRTAAVCFLLNSATSMVVTYVFPYITNADAGNLGAKTYLIFAGCMIICLIVTYFYLPETKGRSAAELDEMFLARVPARKFKGYVCVLIPDVPKTEENPKYPNTDIRNVE